jgi:rare lipoprotein A
VRLLVLLLPTDDTFPGKSDRVRAIHRISARRAFFRSLGFASTVLGTAVLTGCYATSSSPPQAPSPAAVVTQPLAAPPQVPMAKPPIHEVKASYYAPGLAGSKTSTGETYDPSALTAASKTLPLGSVVRVTNPANGNSVRVRINDRGPFVHGRNLDLSHHAAQKLGITHKGVARVKVEAPTSADGEVDGKKGGHDSSP